MKKEGKFELRLSTAVFVVSILFIAVTGSTWASKDNSDWAPDQLVVQPRAGVPPEVLSKVFKGHGAGIKDFIPQVNTIVLHVPADRLETVQNALSRSPHFKSVSKDYLRYQHSTIPNDYWYPGEWHLQKIQAPQAWDFTVGNANVIIAVVDDGAAAVPDLAQKLLTGINIIDGSTYTAGDGGHGTAVTGIIAASTNNSIGVAGITWLNELLPVKVYDSATGYITCSAAAQGIVWAADHGAKVINMSFGGSECSVEKSAIDYAWGKGAVLIASAGNDSNSTPNYPAAYSNVIAVASTDPNDSISSFSNYGSWLSVAAPGGNIVTTYSNGAYAGFSGTSAAAPVVSGIAGLVISANTTLSNSQVKSIIESNADDLGAPGFDIYYGWGRVNAYKAVLAALGAAPPPLDLTPPTASITFPANGHTVSGSIAVSVCASDNVGVTEVELYIDSVLFATDTTSPYSFAWDTTQSSEGTHILQSVAYDAAGNSEASDIIDITVDNFIPDDMPPSVFINSPINGTNVSKTVKIKVKANDNVEVQQVGVYVDGSRIGSAICSASSCSPSFNWNTNKISKGKHIISADASDSAGNIRISDSITVYK